MNDEAQQSCTGQAGGLIVRDNSTCVRDKGPVQEASATGQNGRNISPCELRNKQPQPHLDGKMICSHERQVTQQAALSLQVSGKGKRRTRRRRIHLSLFFLFETLQENCFGAPAYIACLSVKHDKAGICRGGNKEEDDGTRFASHRAVQMMQPAGQTLG
jgi:hypothetical protein